MAFLLAIDPGQLATGVAIFNSAKLVDAFSIQTSKDYSPRDRRRVIYSSLWSMREELSIDKIALEAPVLQGANNNGMQRLLGVIEIALKGVPIEEFHPMTVKKRIGAKDSSKQAVAAQVKKTLLKDPGSKDLITRLIEQENWDALDAIAVGLVCLGKGEERESTKKTTRPSGPAKKKSKTRATKKKKKKARKQS